MVIFVFSLITLKTSGKRRLYFLPTPTTDHSNEDIIMEEEQQDQFRRLPDELIVHILNKVDDARSLVLCISVSKQLASLVPLADRVFLVVPPPTSKPVRQTNHGDRFLCRLMSPHLDECMCSFRCPHEILQGFSEIRSLRIELPFCEKREFQMLKWFARFGTELNDCVIVGANSLQRKDCAVSIQSEDKVEEFAAINSILPEDELELRELWIIYVLIAAASRHLALKELLEDHLKLEEIVITDVNKQGKLCVRKEEMNAIRKSLESESEESEAMAVKSMFVPDLKIRLWHVSELELPESGYVMGGATLIMIKSTKDNDVTEGSGGEYCGWFGETEVLDGEEESDNEGKAFREALKKMKIMKKSKSYSMDIKTFQV